MIKNIIFDFDGVICESVNIKTDAFYEMYLPYGEEIALKVKQHHLENGGMSRYDKFRRYEKEFFHKELSEGKIKILSEIFSSLVKQKVIDASFVKGALEFLQNDSHRYQCFIISATPMDEMIEISKAKKIDTYFQEILGSPQNKIAWGKYILNTYQLQENQTLFVGDAISDYKAAKANGIHFLLRNTDDNRDLFADKIENTNTLENLVDTIKTKF